MSDGAANRYVVSELVAPPHEPAEAFPLAQVRPLRDDRERRAEPVDDVLRTRDVAARAAQALVVETVGGGLEVLVHAVGARGLVRRDLGDVQVEVTELQDSPRRPPR